MWFDSFSAFLHMGGHALYVWLAYAIAAAIIAFNLISPVLEYRRLMRELARRARRESLTTQKEARDD